MLPADGMHLMCSQSFEVVKSCVANTAVRTPKLTNNLLLQFQVVRVSTKKMRARGRNINGQGTGPKLIEVSVKKHIACLVVKKQTKNIALYDIVKR